MDRHISCCTRSKSFVKCRSSLNGFFEVRAYCWISSFRRARFDTLKLCSMSFGGKRGKFPKLVTIFELCHETSLSREHFHSSASADAMLNILVIAIIRICENFDKKQPCMDAYNQSRIKLKPALQSQAFRICYLST